MRKCAHKIRGSKSSSAKLNESIVATCRDRQLSGEAVRALAREFGVSNKAMQLAISGETWAHVRPARQALTKELSDDQ